MPTSLCFLRVVWRMAMSIAPSEMPFQVPDEPHRKYGSTDSSFELAPSPIGPTSWSSGTNFQSSSSVPDWLPRRPIASHSCGLASISSLSTTNTDRFE